jgi:hypothetical protein
MKNINTLISSALLCASTLCAAPIFADIPYAPYTFNLSQSVDYELPANDPQVITNVFRWTVHAECVILDSNKSSDILFKMLRKHSTVNDITLSRGESLRVNVKPNDTFEITAVPGASVEMTNEGDTPITTRCTSSRDYS